MMDTPTFDQCLQVARSGLPHSQAPAQKAIVIGAGMAGLVAALELIRAGHDVTVLEASQRLGGRVRTLRAPFTEGLYGEAGAMRIPLGHRLTMAYIHRFGLPTQPFVTDHPRAFYHFFERTTRREEEPNEANGLAGLLGPGTGEADITARWSRLIRPMIECLRGAPEDAWTQLLAPYERVSTRQFLTDQGWSEPAIEAFGLLFNQEALFDNSFAEVLLEEARDCFSDLVQIPGGMDRLPAAFAPELTGHIRFGARVIALEQDSSTVTVRYRIGTDRASISADRAIVTLPFSVLRFVNVDQPFSLGKQRAIRELHYDAATKVFVECQRRFWEEDEGIFGGRSVTDLPIRTIYYPEHGRETGRGVLLACYTWGEDAERWGALPQSERIALTLEQVAHLHPQVAKLAAATASAVWGNNSYSIGAFADFSPGQQSRLYPHIVQQEGRYHFAGEHASLTHAWIQGAIQSGIRAAWEVRHAP